MREQEGQRHSQERHQPQPGKLPADFGAQRDGHHRGTGDAHRLPYAGLFGQAADETKFQGWGFTRFQTIYTSFKWDGIEITSFGGHLIEQFWSPTINTRADRYGGDLEGRLRFSVEVVQAVAAAVSDRFIVLDRGEIGASIPKKDISLKGLDEFLLDYAHGRKDKH